MAIAVKPSSTIPRKRPAETPYQLDPDQTLKASQALLQHVKTETKRLQEASSKKNLLATGASDSDSEQGDSPDSDKPIWLTLTTKQHIVDDHRLKPSKIAVPHSLNTSTNLRICLITAEPQRAVKNLVADPTFPEHLKSRIAQIIGLTKLKERYKTFETRRQLVSEHDIFLADDRIINRLPAVLGKVFYKGTSKRPVPIIVAQSDRKQVRSQQDKKAKKETSANLKTPLALAKEIEKAIDCVPVSLRPGTSLAVRAGLASFEPHQLVDNISAVVTSVIEKHVAKGWRNVKSIHIKSNLSIAVPLWLADDLWTEPADITAIEAATEGDDEQGQKRKRNPATTKGPQAGVRKKTKLEETKEARSETDRAMGTARKSKLAAQKAKIFAEPL
ncbi:uncharacterized protein A1O9_05333 [Exophiala aquamarina CBS 119918]|uniref:Ribosomal protein L1 n=1 Tax=Exophiala aquamarina CBS 119918 TaxID=1182545 RepID=A0A072PC35_9EURO|nr:uncharacterized protein A1O9_05333 [Exophiala aquamarina CBS 119918]KEF57416.1 hypothetical protein A1O9_05333 [Exophiala aquamarina CBS 119918]